MAGTHFKGPIVAYGATVPITTGLTLDASYNGVIFLATNAGTINITVPAGLPTEFSVALYQLGAGKITFVASGTTITNVSSQLSTSGTAGAAVALQWVGSNAFVLTGSTGA